ncbi:MULTISPECIES: phosphoadenosine phosphosulfate reductase family protein [Haloferacaceae]|uniref:Phosphoadenosine phosphosulfate reductase family protein n=2 Tax=Haloferacaceae TaxID=1644056 RepID=A0ABD6DAA5_9EURY|nr:MULTISPECIES: phosphoadenosine phosphosulfate reductase family protein [Halorubraceae]
MIEMEEYGIAPPPEAIHSETIAKPQPQSEPLDILESDRILEVPNGRGEKTDAVLFSGGDDSLALTHLAMEEGWADFVIHLETNSSIPENLDYVREVCETFCWPLLIISSPMPLDTFAYRYGFAGAPSHTMAYNYFKGRQLGHFYRKKHGNVKYLSGVRKLESDRRMENIEAEVQYESTSHSGNFTGWWVSPLIEKSDDWITRYREEHSLPQNPVSAKIHRSGDCQCLAYGNRQEELIMIESEYPDFAAWLLSVEKRVQEYRGRVMILEETHPEIAKQVESLREETRPYPMRLSVLKEHFPTVFREIVDVDAETAILKGQTEPTSYIGHGGLSSKELRDLTASADASQQTLCESCGDPCYTLSPAVQANVEEAKERAARATPTQQTLPGTTDDYASSPAIASNESADRTHRQQTFE